MIIYGRIICESKSARTDIVVDVKWEAVFMLDYFHGKRAVPVELNPEDAARCVFLWLKVRRGAVLHSQGRPFYGVPALFVHVGQARSVGDVCSCAIV